MIEVKEILNIAMSSLTNSAMFPYRTGMLKNNFVDRDSLTVNADIAEVSVLTNAKYNYGRVLQRAPSIRYKLRKNNEKRYTYIKHKNRHFRYIENIINSDVINTIEAVTGAKYVGK